MVDDVYWGEVIVHKYHQVPAETSTVPTFFPASLEPWLVENQT
jgi:hypothetical protein